MAKEKIPEELGLALVLTVYEAKGLEFDDVLLYNFFTDSEVCHTDCFSHDTCICVSYPATRGKRIWSWVESLPKVPVSVLEYHPFSVGLGVFDVGFDNGYELFQSMRAGSPHALPSLIFLYSPSSKCLVPKCQLPVFTSYCYPWLPRMLKLEWALRRALQVKARVAVSTNEDRTGQGQSIERDNSWKTNEAWFLPIGSGNAGTRTATCLGAPFWHGFATTACHPCRQWQQEYPQIDPQWPLCSSLLWLDGLPQCIMGKATNSRPLSLVS